MKAKGGGDTLPAMGGLSFGKTMFGGGKDKTKKPKASGDTTTPEKVQINPPFPRSNHGYLAQQLLARYYRSQQSSHCPRIPPVCQHPPVSYPLGIVPLTRSTKQCYVAITNVNSSTNSST